MKNRDDEPIFYLLYAMAMIKFLSDRKEKRKKWERQKRINEWAGEHCKTCIWNDDRGTEYVNCQAEHEVQKDVDIACIHYEHAVLEADKGGE